MTSRTAAGLALLALIGCKDDGPTPDSEVPSTDSEFTDADGDGSPTREDCDDADPNASPDSPELCDGVDNDCDGQIDDGASDASSWYADADGDGYGAGEPVSACEAPEGYVAQDGDCEDGEATIHPGAEEVCDGVDNDCDGLTDDADEQVGGQSSWYADGDGDGYGAGDTLEACVAPSGTSALAGDCDDADAGVNPEAAEVCDGVDNDCDGLVDPGLAGSGEACAASSCQAVLSDQSAAATGLYWLDLGAGSAQYHCEMSEEGGGWILLAVSSDDGTATWTWDARRLLDSDTSTVGSVQDITLDFKSDAWHALAFTDLLFIHRPSDVTAAYAAVGDGSADLGSFIGALDEERCLDPDTDGHPLSGGSLSTYGSPLCSSDLYFNVADQDGSNGCGTSSAFQGSHGPTWNMRNNNGCPFDDPGRASMGGDAYTTDQEWEGRGFGEYLGLNTGAEGAGENTLEVYAR
ncbi:MAG: putative metal-binding motif-containing protein [Alphaproteobacteria bacterium]|nr:putative metal-binding motif-containing protein [Alphaproteobacteria bacterium]MCB9792974.1 putative metal-binding motif-containing protein [Alphaproteobacteria bacterium]